MRVIAALLAFVSLSAGETFSFAGFHRDMDLASLLDRYPKSEHDVSPRGGVRKRTAQDNLQDWIREFFRNRGASGTYTLRLTPGESHDHVYYVQAERREGVTDRLWLLLEEPVELAKPGKTARGNETRYPACNALLNPLTAKYGKPQALPSRSEEALESLDYVWTNSPEIMKLQCGRYQGSKSVFAIGVSLERMAQR